MKKVFLVVAIFSAMITQAQTGFVVTDTVNTTVNITVDSVYIAPIIHLGGLVDSSECWVDLFTWYSEAAKDSLASRIIIKGDDGALIDKVSIIYRSTDSGIDLLNKVIAKLEELYGWTIE